MTKKDKDFILLNIVEKGGCVHLENFVSWLATIIVFLIFFVVMTFIIQFIKLRKLKKRVKQLEGLTEIPKEKDIRIDLKLIERIILTSTNEDMTIYAQNLYLANDTKNVSEHFDQTVLLDKKVVDYGLMRLSSLEDNYDLSKFFPSLVVILTAFLTTYNIFFQEIFFKDYILLRFGFPLIVILGVYFYLTKQIGDYRKKRASIIFFKGILLYAKENGK